ncbi:MAG: dihydrolipoamide acetyltransferase family protein [Myxococcota bacterium]
MAFEFKLPDIGEGVVEGEIVKWLVQSGDAIDIDQPMVEVMTDKATVVIPSPVKGTVKETRGGEGDLVEVHSVICVIEQEGGASDSAESSSASAESSASAKVESSGAPKAEASPKKGGKVLAAPATRRLARELGVDISTVQGSGPAGRVLETDVRGAASSGQRSHPDASIASSFATNISPAVPAHRSSSGASGSAQTLARSLSASSWPGEADERIPVRGLRRRIWDKMAQSKASAAHFTFVEECNCESLVQTRQRFNARLVEGESKLNYLPFIVKAVVAALKRFPTLNGHVDDADQSFIQRVNYHIGIAVSSDRGLVVPVVRHADRRSIIELSQEIARLAEAVRTNTLSPEDLGDSTFTITSLGKDGGIFATPIINYPEVAILGVHKMQKTPVVNDQDEIVVRPMMNLSLSFDHRLIDGHIGAEFTYAVVRLLEDPDRLMMEMA